MTTMNKVLLLTATAALILLAQSSGCAAKMTKAKDQSRRISDSNTVKAKTQFQMVSDGTTRTYRFFAHLTGSSDLYYCRSMNITCTGKTKHVTVRSIKSEDCFKPYKSELEGLLWAQVRISDQILPGETTCLVICDQNTKTAKAKGIVNKVKKNDVYEIKSQPGQQLTFKPHGECKKTTLQCPGIKNSQITWKTEEAGFQQWSTGFSELTALQGSVLFSEVTPSSEPRKTKVSGQNTVSVNSHRSELQKTKVSGQNTVSVNSHRSELQKTKVSGEKALICNVMCDTSTAADQKNVNHVNGESRFVINSWTNKGFSSSYKFETTGNCKAIRFSCQFFWTPGHSSAALMWTSKKGGCSKTNTLKHKPTKIPGRYSSKHAETGLDSLKIFGLKHNPNTGIQCTIKCDKVVNKANLKQCR